MAYAGNGMIASDYFEGSIAITDEEIQAALEAMRQGKLVSIASGVLEFLDPPEPEPTPELVPIPEPETPEAKPDASD